MYRPDPERDENAPLTDQERALADRIFRVIRYLADVTYGPATAPHSAYMFSVWFDEAQPPDARVQIIYDCREFSSGYREDGVGPDLETALDRLSDDDKTNGTAALIGR